MSPSRRPLFAFPLSFLLACGGAQHSSATHGSAHGTASREIQRGSDGLPVDEHDMNERVESWQRRQVHVLRAASRCVSGAMDIYLSGTSVRWARSIRMRMYAPRRMSFNVDIREPASQPSMYLASTMFGLGVDDHARILRDHTACIAQSAPSSAPSSSPASGVAVVASPAPSSPAPRRQPRPSRTRAPNRVAVEVTASASPPPAAQLAIDAETPVRGFVDLGAAPFTQSPGGYSFTKEFVLERTYAEIPMNDVNRSWVINRERIESPLVLRIWTQEPIDFDGVVIQIEDLVLEPHIPEGEYERVMARRVAVASHRQDEFTTLCREHPENERCYFTPENQRRFVNAGRPPPPPRNETPPSRPSADHVWIGGGWQWNGSDYVWIAGMWRFVPPAIVATAAGSTTTTRAPSVSATAATAAPTTNATSTTNTTNTTNAASGSTVTSVTATASTNTSVAPTPSTATATASASSAPAATASFAAPAAAVIMPASAPVAPPPRNEAIPPAPQAGAMWIAGYWQWDGRAWAWTSGHWQMPPHVDARWTPPAVQVGSGGVQVFMPGGWLRLGP